MSLNILIGWTINSLDTLDNEIQLKNNLFRFRSRKIESRKSTISAQLWHGVVTLTGASIRWKARCWHRRQWRPPGNESDSSQMNPSPQWLFRMRRTYQKLWAESTNAMEFYTAMRPFQSIRSLLVHPKDKHRAQDICECVYKVPCKNCNKTYIGETGRAFGVRLQEHRQELSQREVRAYIQSTSRSLTGEQNKSAVTDHAICLNHIIDWDQAKVINRESNRVDRWIKEAIHIRKEQDKSMNRDEGSYQLSHIYDNLFASNLSGERRLDRPFRRRLQSKLKRQH